MEYKALTLCLFLCYAALSSAQSGEGSGPDVTPTVDGDITTGLDLEPCDGAATVYGLGAGGSRGTDFIFNKMESGESQLQSTLL